MRRPTSLRTRALARGRARCTAGFDWNPVMVVEPTIMPTSVPGAYDKNSGSTTAADADGGSRPDAESAEAPLGHLQRVAVGPGRRVRLAVRAIRARHHVGGGHQPAGGVEPGDRQ